MDRKPEELLAKLICAIDAYYSDEAKYGAEYAVKDLLAFLERITDYTEVRTVEITQ